MPEADLKQWAHWRYRVGAVEREQRRLTEQLALGRKLLRERTVDDDPLAAPSSVVRLRVRLEQMGEIKYANEYLLEEARYLTELWGARCGH